MVNIFVEITAEKFKALNCAYCWMILFYRKSEKVADKSKNTRYNNIVG